MPRLWPSSAEASQLPFLWSSGPAAWRPWIAAALFVVGLAVCLLVPLPLPLPLILGVPLIVAGHLVLWVRRSTTAPGGSTPRHEEIWAPVEADWLERVEALERRGELWDTSPWDVTNRLGCMVLFGFLLLVAAAAVGVGVTLGADAAFRFLVAGVALVAPQWLSGMRTTWNPSELRLKGESLAVARRTALELAGERLEPVDLLALRDGKKDRYPVDARLMLRPAVESGSGFLGVQVQVAINNVRGSDYPYLYCVVLGKEGFPLPPAMPAPRPSPSGLRLVWERGAGDGAEYLVVRRYADNRGGWQTKPKHVRGLVEVAVDLALELAEIGTSE